MSTPAERRATAILDLARQNGVIVATAESCTGGMIAAALTDIAGSSDVFDRGFVTYSNAAKAEMLGVSARTIADHGAVSSETAREMADGALSRSRASIAISVTGIAGPGGATPDKPAGLVWFGLARKGAPATAQVQTFPGLDRAGVRHAATLHALIMLEAALRG